MLEKPKLSFDIGSITIKANIELSGNRKTPQKHFHDHYCLDGHLGIDDWDFTVFGQCETYKQLKERNLLAAHLKSFYPLGLNQKEEYLYIESDNQL